MRRHRAYARTGLCRWARKIGRITGQTEMAAREVPSELGARVHDFKMRQEKILGRKMTDLNRASHRALKELRKGLRNATAELSGAMGWSGHRSGWRAMLPRWR